MRDKCFHPLFLLVLLLAACGRQLPDSASVLMPQIRSLAVTDISATGATLIASVSNESQLVGYGFTIGEAAAPASRNLPATLQGNLITITLQDLAADSEYSFRAYIDNGDQIRHYSDYKSFTTLSAPEPEIPEIPDQPDKPDNPDNPDTPDNPDNPDNPDTPEPTETSYVEIPDEAFRSWVLWNYDADKDGRLSTAEAALITTVETVSDAIHSLTGIEHFPALIKLNAEGTREGDTGFGQLETLDLSGNPLLDHLYIPHNRIRTLDLSPVPGLSHFEVYMNELQTLDVSMLKALTLMNVGRNKLTRLDVRGLDALDELHCDESPLREILLDNAALRYIDCHGTDVQTLDFSKCPKLNIVDCLDCKSLKTIYLAKGHVLGTLRKPASATIVYKDE